MCGTTNMRKVKHTSSHVNNTANKRGGASGVGYKREDVAGAEAGTTGRHATWRGERSERVGHDERGGGMMRETGDAKGGGQEQGQTKKTQDPRFPKKRKTQKKNDMSLPVGTCHPKKMTCTDR